MSPNDSIKTPRVFISYSWTSEEHQNWVLRLATELRESGVDVILDKWDLREGQDAYAFMEKMVTDPSVDRVLLICDARYVEKANSRVGGVGAEAQIISPVIYSSVDQSKFVAVVRERNADGQAYVPAYYGSRIYIDMSSDDIYEANFEQLLRWIFDKPVHVKPPLGTPPAFIREEAEPTTSNSALHRRTLEAIRTQKNFAIGLLEEYLESCIKEIEKYRIADNGNSAFDDEVVASIERFAGVRNDIIRIFFSLNRYDRSESAPRLIHRFFEQLLPFFDPPQGTQVYREWDFDNFRFIVHELFLYAIAIPLRSERFDFVAPLLSDLYYSPRTERRPGRSATFVEFHQFMKSLEHRNRRLELQRLSVRADMLHDRCKGLGLDFRQIAQADFILFLRSCVDALRNSADSYPDQWWPETLLYVREFDGAFELFVRSESASYFEKFKGVLGVGRKTDLEAVLRALASGQLHLPKWRFERIYPETWMGYQLLCTRP